MQITCIKAYSLKLLFTLMKYPILVVLGILLVVGSWSVIKSQQHDDTEHDENHTHESVVLVPKEPVRADGTFTISTSFYPLQFALERIAGDRAVITNIGTGRDPHLFRPSTQTILSLQESDLVVLQGADFEPWGDAVARQLRDAGVPVLFATETLTLREDADSYSEEHGAGEEHDEEHEEDHHEHGQFDPHTWLDPVLFSKTVLHLSEALTILDPENADFYTANADVLRAELTEIDAAYQTRLALCTYEEAIVSHDAFGYLAERYNISFHPIAGLSTQDTPSAVTLATLREEAAEGVGAILLEENSIAAYGETLARETGLRTLTINPVAFIIPEGENYLTIMSSNLDSLVSAFACNE